MTIAIRDDFDSALIDLEKSKKLCEQLMKTPHYSKLGEVGIFTIIQKAKSTGLNVIEALNGGMYFINGKVELTSNTMNYLIRAKGHSITKDSRSDKNVCILHGKRIDNGDTWTSSFSIEEAKMAGIYKNAWEKYPQRMLFARALSILARELFPDVIKGCYVEGEISNSTIDSTSFNESVSEIAIENKPEVNASEIDYLIALLELDIDYKEKIFNRTRALGFKNFYDIPRKLYETILQATKEKFDSENHSKLSIDQEKN